MHLGFSVWLSILLTVCYVFVFSLLKRALQIVCCHYYNYNHRNYWVEIAGCYLLMHRRGVCIRERNHVCDWRRGNNIEFHSIRAANASKWKCARHACRSRVSPLHMQHCGMQGRYFNRAGARHSAYFGQSHSQPETDLRATQRQTTRFRRTAKEWREWKASGEM